MQRKQSFGLVLAAIAMAAMFGTAASAQYALPASPEVEQRAQKILSQMTQDEKLDYIGGYKAF